MLSRLKVVSSRVLGGSRYRSNIVRIAGASGIAQLLPIAVLPVVTRLYSAADFGVLAYFVAMLAVATSMAVFRLDWLVSILRNRFRASAAFVVGMLIASLVAVAAFFIPFDALSTDAMNGEGVRLGSLALLLPVAVIGSSAFLLLSAWFVRQAVMGPVASAKIRQSVFGTSAMVAWGAISPSAIGLVASNLINTSAGVVSLYRSTQGQILSSALRLRPRYIIAVVRRYAGRIGYSGATGVINAIGVYGPPVLLGILYSARELGWFSVMLRLGLAPTTAISTAVSQSFWGETSVTIGSNKQETWRLFNKTSRMLFGLAGVIFFACLLGPLYIGPTLGAEWMEAGAILAALAPMIAMQVVASTLAPIVTVIGAVRWMFWWDCSRSALVVVTIFAVALLDYSILHATIAYSMVSTVMYTILYLKTRSLALGFKADE